MSQNKNNKVIVILCTILLNLQIFTSQAEPTALNGNTPGHSFPSFTPPDALSIERPRLPETLPRELPKKPEFRLPPIDTSPDKTSRLSNTFKLFVKQIKINGNTVFTAQELQTIIGNYENRSITNAELQTLRHQLTRYYIDHGYINSGVILPDQEVQEGIIQLQVIEGELSALEVTGNDWLRTSYIDDRISQSFAAPLNIKAVQDQLLQLQQDPLIESVNAELRPGLKPGESRMHLHITEARPYQAGVVVANNRSPSIGGISGNFWLKHNNLTGFGDALFFSYSLAEGLDDYVGSYSIPLSAYGTRLNLYYQYSEADVVENSIENANIHSRSQTYGVSLSQPVFRTSRQTLTLTLVFEHRRSKTYINGSPFSFALGVPEQGDDKGESKISVLRFIQDWLHRSQSQVIAGRSTFNLGIGVLDATIVVRK